MSGQANPQLDAEQTAAIQAPPGPLCIIAGAGTGKTTALVGRIVYQCQQGNWDPAAVLAVTHSTKAAGNMRDRLTRYNDPALTKVTTKTFHAAALAVCTAHWQYSGREQPLKLADSTYSFAKEALKRVDRKLPASTEVADLLGEIGWAKASLVSPLAYPAAAAAVGRGMDGRTLKTVAKCYQDYNEFLHGAGLVDFTDLLLIATALIERNPAVKTQVAATWKHILVDEYQDTDPAQEAFLNALLAGRNDITVVGDARQCHPAGTTLVTQLGDVAIESLDPNLHILRSLDRANSVPLGARANRTPSSWTFEVSSRPYSGTLIRLHSAGRVLDVTPDHVCLARWKQEAWTATGTKVLYLMQKGDWFRIGVGALNYYGSNFGPKSRLRSEGADAVWVLDVYPDQRSALIAEAVLAANFGLPMTTFVPCGWSGGSKDLRKPEDLNLLYSQVQDMRGKALRVLAHFGRDIRFPFIRSGNSSQRGFRNITEIEACNIVSGWMTVPHDGVRKPEWLPVTVTSRKYSGLVYSLEVHPHHNYAANHIFVNNCIYGFKGSNPHLLSQFSQRHPGTTVVRLIRDYRSSPQVVDFANKLMNTDGESTLIGCGPAGEDPELLVAGDELAEAAAVAAAIKEEIQSGTAASDIAVLYRYNAQSAAFEAALSSAGIAYTVLDSEKFFDRNEILTVLRNAWGRMRHGEDAGQVPEATHVLKLALEDAGFDPDKPPAVAGGARERWEALAALAELVRAMGAGRPAREVFEELAHRRGESHQVATRTVVLSTLHKAKGLEWPVVFLPRMVEGSLPSAYAKTTEELAEERRLAYVGITRAGRRLVLSYARRRGGVEKSWPATPSRFLDDLGLTFKAPAKPKGARKSESLPKSAAVQLRPGDLAVLEGLRSWRKAKAKAKRMPDFSIISDAALEAIATRRPADELGLRRIPGLGAKKAVEFKDELLELLARYPAS